MLSLTHIRINSYTRFVRQVSNVFDKSTFFCKTKPNSPSVQMNLKSAKTRDYINFWLCVRHKNKAKTKPIQSQTKPICEMTKMNVNSIKTDDYGKNPAFAKNRNKAKTKPKQTQFKANFSYFPVAKSANASLYCEN